MYYSRCISIFIAILFITTPAHALLDLELTKGIESPLPIAVVPFAGQQNENTSNDIAAVITHDLKTSGRFQVLPTGNMPSQPHHSGEIVFDVWKGAGVDSVVVGSVQPVGMGRYQVNFSLVDVYGNKKVLAQDTYAVSSKQLHRLAHHISNIIYEKLTGIPGIFSTRIAYVLVTQAGDHKQYHLMVADVDGDNPRAILISKEPLMSPAWSHDGKKIAYVSFENKRSQIFVSDIASGERQRISHYPGINGAPAWSPDDKKLAIVLSKSGAPKIYEVSVYGGNLKQLTFGNTIDTEPTWSPDGRSIVFTSDRGGAPQLYKLDRSSGQIERLTFSGSYNARASFTPDGKRIAMIHNDGDGFTIAVQNLQNGNIDRITKSGREDSPSVAPNGNMVLYGTEYGELGAVSLDGKISIRIPASGGTIQGPAWGPNA